MTREQIEARIAELEAANEAATSCVAAVGARHEEIEGLKRQLPCSSAVNEDVRWAVNYLLEQIAAKFEAWDTFDLFRSEAAATVRSFKQRNVGSDVAISDNSAHAEPQTAEVKPKSMWQRPEYDPELSLIGAVKEMAAPQAVPTREALTALIRSKAKVSGRDAWEGGYYYLSNAEEIAEAILALTRPNPKS